MLVLIFSLAAIFCDFYNSPGDCEWHYKPCGADCMKTCRNPSGNCSNLITALEGTIEIYFGLTSLICVFWPGFKFKSGQQND